MTDQYDIDIVGVLEGADKNSSVDAHWDHQRLFHRFQCEPINRIEIGVAGGSSLKILSKDAGPWIFVGHLRTRQGDHAAAARA